MNGLMSSDAIFINILTVWIIQIMKSSKSSILSWINFDTSIVNKVVASLGAVLTTAGIAFAWSPETGTLSITGLTAQGFATVLFEIIKNYAFQHVIYKAAFQPSALLKQLESAPTPQEVPSAQAQ